MLEIPGVIHWSSRVVQGCPGDPQGCPKDLDLVLVWFQSAPSLVSIGLSPSFPVRFHSSFHAELYSDALQVPLRLPSRPRGSFKISSRLSYLFQFHPVPHSCCHSGLHLVSPSVSLSVLIYPVKNGFRVNSTIGTRNSPPKIDLD